MRCVGFARRPQRKNMHASVSIFAHFRFSSLPFRSAAAVVDRSDPNLQAPSLHVHCVSLLFFLHVPFRIIKTLLVNLPL
jgi:hypothetical protein